MSEWSAFLYNEEEPEVVAALVSEFLANGLQTVDSLDEIIMRDMLPEMAFELKAILDGAGSKPTVLISNKEHFEPILVVATGQFASFKKAFEAELITEADISDLAEESACASAVLKLKHAEGDVEGAQPVIALLGFDSYIDATTPKTGLMSRIFGGRS